VGFQSDREVRSAGADSPQVWVVAALSGDCGEMVLVEVLGGVWGRSRFFSSAPALRCQTPSAPSTLFQGKGRAEG
jgi:hypothetical protein